MPAVVAKDMEQALHIEDSHTSSFLVCRSIYQRNCNGFFRIDVRYVFVCPQVPLFVAVFGLFFAYWPAEKVDNLMALLIV